jgi:cold shock CspA family protein
MNGTITRLMGKKQFGFIRSEGKSYFFHRDDFNGHWEDLEEDFEKLRSIKVEFVEVESEKGLRAADVKRLDYPNQG